MEKLSPLLAEWGSMKFLISEILLCKGAFARDKLKHREAAWQRKYAEQEDAHDVQLKNSEERLGNLQTRLDSSESEKSALHTSLESNKSAVHKAHIEVQQLSKRQRDTQERLQKIISEKDREISQLHKEADSGKNTPPRPLGFSSRKPANPQPAAAPPPSRPATPANPPSQSAPQNRSTAGGRPNLQSVDPGYKPGTQTTQDDFDKTQVLKSEGDHTSTTSYDRTAATTRSTNTDSTGAHDSTTAFSGTGYSGSTDPGANRTSQYSDSTSAYQTSSSSTTDVPGESSGGRSMGRKKRSLWDRVKSSVTKKDQ